MPKERKISYALYVRVNHEVYEALGKKSVKEDRSISYLINQALEKYLKKEVKKEGGNDVQTEQK